MGKDILRRRLHRLFRIWSTGLGLFDDPITARSPIRTSSVLRSCCSLFPPLTCVALQIHPAWNGKSMSSELEILARDTFVGRCVSIAALTLLFYDHLITFADEVHLIWPAKLGLVKAIFFLNRYIGSIWIAIAFTTLVSLLFFPLRCRGWITANTYIEVINIQMLNFIIATRVYDIWQSQRLAFFVLAPFWLIHFVLDIFIITDNTIKVSAGYGYSQSANMCIADPRGIWTLWLNGIIYHALILLLLMWIWFSTPRTEQTPFVRLVIRDGFIYFITILSMMLFNLLVWRYARTSLVLLPYTVVWVVLNGSLSRTLLSLGSVQTSEEWGHRAKLQFIPKDIELGRVLSAGTVSTYTTKDDHGELVNSCVVHVVL
ncbi:transmembrane protein, putative [Rhizoctonia solani AG-3 Rhs1AP]|uniref:Transmembrane protein, putative n=2 Tax=Rhizoctonia solani TaxID=456999 RepID=X8J5H2_9AGAM|nr:transmembrane protein, putative [Rhizoctonia solani AG-3 Rhs1AP]